MSEEPIPVIFEPAIEPLPAPNPESKYAGDAVYNDTPVEQKYRKLDFINPAYLVSFYDRDISDGHVTLHPWQLEYHEEIGRIKPTSQHPEKFCLVAANGSGKDKFIVAPFAIWFTLTKIRSRVILTSSSGTQLTAQTETYIRDLASKVNEFHGQEIFRIRQRYIFCRLTGSEIRMFATDEKGKAEGYHPFDAHSEMAIIVNEGKSVTEEIHGALRRCTGYNYWLEVSTPGEPAGFFFRAAKTWKNVQYVTSYDCPHLSEEDREEDKRELGEHSALFRSKHLALFTSLDSDTVIPSELIQQLIDNRPVPQITGFHESIGIDLAAGGAENSLCRVKGGVCLGQRHFRETDTTITAQRIDRILREEFKVDKSFEYIYADDGGVGHAVIDMLVRMGWNINRVLNQWAAFNKRSYGNRGAENWYRVKRLIEERLFDVATLDEKTREQLGTRHYKQSAQGGRIFLEPKKEAIAHGRPSPDRADAFVLACMGLSVSEFLDKPTPKVETMQRGEKLGNSEQILLAYEEQFTYGKFNKKPEKGPKIYGSLQIALNYN